MVSQRLVQQPDGTAKVVIVKPDPVRPRPQPCPECGGTMSVIPVPSAHYDCPDCGITRDINPETGLMTDYPYNSTYIGDVVFDDFD